MCVRVINNILQSEFSKWQGKNITLTLKIKTMIITDKKHYILVNSSPPPSKINSPSHKRERKTRIVNLRGQNQAKAQFYTPHQHYHKEISDRWIYTSKRYKNHT